MNLLSAKTNPQLWIKESHKEIDKFYTKAKKAIDKNDFIDPDYERLYVNTVTMSILNKMFPESGFDSECFIMNASEYTELIRTALDYIQNKELVTKGKRVKKYLADGGFVFEDTTKNE